MKERKESHIKKRRIEGRKKGTNEGKEGRKVGGKGKKLAGKEQGFLKALTYRKERKEGGCKDRILERGRNVIPKKGHWIERKEENKKEKIGSEV